MEQERQHRAAALQRKSLAKVALLNAASTSETSKGNGDKRMAATTTTIVSQGSLLHTMAAAGEFDSDVDTDEDGDGGEAVDRLTMLVSYRNGTHHAYPHWMPVNIVSAGRVR